MNVSFFNGFYNDVMQDILQRNNLLVEQQKQTPSHLEKDYILQKIKYLSFFKTIFASINEKTPDSTAWETFIQNEAKYTLKTPTKDSVHFGKSASHIFKVTICGDGGVGKTALVNRFFGKECRNNYQPTIGAEFSTSKIEIDYGSVNNVDFQIWDLAGQQQFEYVRKGFYKGAAGAIIMFDITRPKSFSNIFQWIVEIWSTLGYTTPLVILGNKQDLEEKRAIAEEAVMGIAGKISELSRYYKGFRVMYLPCSTKTGLNVIDAFKLLAFSVLEWKDSIGE